MLHLHSPQQSINCNSFNGYWFGKTEEDDDDDDDEEDDYGVLWESGDVGGFECFIEADQDADNAEAAEVLVCLTYLFPVLTTGYSLDQ